MRRVTYNRSPFKNFADGFKPFTVVKTSYLVSTN